MVYYGKKYIMQIIDRSTGEMKCRVCGATHFADTQENGFFKRGSYQCRYGCKL